jgi:hypothetical protein
MPSQIPSAKACLELRDGDVIEVKADRASSMFSPAKVCVSLCGETPPKSCLSIDGRRC